MYWLIARGLFESNHLYGAPDSRVGTKARTISAQVCQQCVVELPDVGIPRESLGRNERDYHFETELALDQREADFMGKVPMSIERWRR
jgi:hypothetical protein